MPSVSGINDMDGIPMRKNFPGCTIIFPPAFHINSTFSHSIMKYAQIAMAVIILSQPGLGQATVDSTRIHSDSTDSGSRPHSVTRDVLVSSLYGAGGLGVGLLIAPSAPTAVIGWYLGSLFGTARVHQDYRFYPSELLLSGVGLWLGFATIALGQFAGWSGGEVSSLVIMGLGVTMPSMGSTAGYHMGKARRDKKAANLDGDGPF